MVRLLFALVFFLSALASYAKSDSIGVYAIVGSNANRIDCIKYSQVKVKSAVVVAKSKLCFIGSTSKNRFAGKATFRLYFGTPDPSQVMDYFAFTPSRSINDFVVIKFKAKKDKRYITANTISIVGGSMGAKASRDVEVTSTKINDRVYEITVSGNPGEYCIAPLINGAAGYAGVFDFTLM